MSICARNDCEVQFTAKTHNQKYCGPECCRVATNKRIMDKYYDKKDRKAGKERLCKNCRKTKLSRYNDGHICGACDIASLAAANTAVVNMLASVSWQE